MIKNNLFDVLFRSSPMKTSVMSKKEERIERAGGFSNQTALILIAVCYPLGIVLAALVISNGSQNPGSWTPQAQTIPGIQNLITEQEATAVIREWWDVRPRVFASPYDASAANSAVASGPLWTDLTKTDGPVAWLRNNNQYYTYQGTTIERVISTDFQQVERPSIVVRVRTQDTLHGPGLNRPSSSVGTYKYTFARESGRWKIWNYEKI
jgi:hypothetical protein